jgi:hypothetical protein
MCTEWARRHWPAGIILALLALAGCKKDDAAQQNKAEAAIDKALDAWARGESADKLTTGSPPIQIDDPDWKSGVRLLSFLTAESKPSTAAPGQFHCRVSLALQDRAGKKSEKEVHYEVALGATISITRVTAQ